MTGRQPFFDPRRAVQLAALALAVLAAGFFLLAPVYSSESVTSDGTVTTGAGTLAQANGSWVVWLLLVPVVLVAVPAFWWGRGRRTAHVTGTALLLAFCLVSLLSVGLFYLPAAVVSGLALLAPPAAREEPASPAGPTDPVSPTNPAGPPAPRPA